MKDKARFLRYLEGMSQGKMSGPNSLAGWFGLVPCLVLVADGVQSDRRALKAFYKTLETGIRKHICLEIGPDCVFGLCFGHPQFGLGVETVMLDFEFANLSNNHILTLVLKAKKGGVGLFWGKVKKSRRGTSKLQNLDSVLCCSGQGWPSDDDCRKYGQAAKAWLWKGTQEALPEHTDATLALRIQRNAMLK